MAYGDYIHCCKCDVKLIYDGDRSQRQWWKERFDCEPQIECPNCKPQHEWVGLADDEIKRIAYSNVEFALARNIEAKLKEKNT